MKDIVVNGSNKLSGKINIQGAKNSVLPILAGTLLCDGECIINNCPAIADVCSSFKILTHLGCKCTHSGNCAVINSDNVNSHTILDSLMREMRSSVMFLGAIIGRMGKAVISSPGGCELGPRPIDLHLSALRKMGTVITEEHGNIYCSVPERLHGTEINLAFPSVGATENIILAAVTANGKTVIHNAAREPEISDLGDFLNSAGAKICGCGSDTIIVEGVKKLHPTQHTVIPDRIVAATYISCAAVTGSKITLDNIMPSHMSACLNIFRESGCDIEIKGKTLTVSAPEKLCRVPTVRSLVYPGFPTDAGPLIAAMLTVCDGTCVFVENIFENRFRYADELNRLGANIKIAGKIAVIEGVNSLSGATCKCTDLRGGAALVTAALAAEGETRITETSHIFRGYADIVSDLKSLGANINYIKE